MDTIFIKSARESVLHLVIKKAHKCDLAQCRTTFQIKGYCNIIIFLSEQI